jgi:hypothetical protein
LDYSQIYYLPLTINIEDYYKHRSRFPVIVLLQVSFPNATVSSNAPTARSEKNQGVVHARYAV